MNTPLGNIPTEQFLQQYWQQKPLLIRQAFADFRSPINADELAGLALEDDVTSRIVLQQDNDHIWDCWHGPFSEETFTQLPDSHWTLLVQDVEKHLPELNNILESFYFLPRWRMDDLMISYAADQGSVGPHLDQYDVFLLQATGQRRWQIQLEPDTDHLIEGIELQILKNFNADEEWLLNPGDMLYLPPGVAHHGIAEDECMTFSIGFRAPCTAELISSIAHDLSQQCTANTRFRDTLINCPENRGELDRQSLDQLTALIHNALSDPHLVEQAIAKHLAEPAPVIANYPVRHMDITDFATALKNSHRLTVHPAIRMLYIDNAGELTWFLDGERITVDADDAQAIKTLCNHYSLPTRSLILGKQFMAALFGLYTNGAIQLEG